MEIEKFSKKYTVRLLREEDVPQVFELCKKNPQYYRHCPPFVTMESIRMDRQALPPGKTMDDKHYVGYFAEGRLIAVLDFIHAFPTDQIDFIGFFMVEQSFQKKGVGSGIIQELCAYRKQEGTKSIRLGWVQGNPQAEHFWKKNGFVETGALSKTENYWIVIAEKIL